MSQERTRLTLDLDPQFQRRLKMLAASKGITMRTLCVRALEREIALQDTNDAMHLNPQAILESREATERIFKGSVSTLDSTDLIREAREERSASQ